MLVGLLVGFYGISTFIGYLCQIHFHANIQFYFKLFSSAKVRSFSVKTVLFQADQFSQTVLIQTIQFSISLFLSHS